MAGKGKEKQDEPPKRLNRVVGAGEAIARALDPALRKRGFASRDIITHWAAMAPAPYDRVAAPDRLVWPRNNRSAEGATLYLRCAAGQQLALQHEGDKVAAAINRYFGYVLVGSVKLSLEPFTGSSDAGTQARPKPSASIIAEVEQEVARVEDPGLQDALRRLGQGIRAKSR